MEDLQKEFIPYDRALRLKKLGFDEPCFGRWWFRADMHRVNEEKLEIIKSYYFELPEYYILAPTFSAAFRWFREEHDLWSTLSYDEDDSGKILWGIDAFEYGIGPLFFLEEYDTYEEAELACLDKLLEIVESKQKEDGK